MGGFIWPSGYDTDSVCSCDSVCGCDSLCGCDSVCGCLEQREQLWQQVMKRREQWLAEKAQLLANRAKEAEQLCATRQLQDQDFLKRQAALAEQKQRDDLSVAAVRSEDATRADKLAALVLDDFNGKKRLLEREQQQLLAKRQEEDIAIKQRFASEDASFEKKREQLDAELRQYQGEYQANIAAIQQKLTSGMADYVGFTRTRSDVTPQVAQATERLQQIAKLIQTFAKEDQLFLDKVKEEDRAFGVELATIDVKYKELTAKITKHLEEYHLQSPKTNARQEFIGTVEKLLTSLLQQKDRVLTKYYRVLSDREKCYEQIMQARTKALRDLLPVATKNAETQTEPLPDKVKRLLAERDAKLQRKHKEGKCNHQ